MNKNYVSILRSPLIGNAFSRLKRELDDNISLEDAISEARKYALEKGYNNPSNLFWNGNYYRFIEEDVFLINEDNKPIKKIRGSRLLMF